MSETADTLSLAGKVALVTGGGSGIGRAVVSAFVREGARVVVMDLSKQRVEQTAAEFADGVVAIAGDVTHYEDNASAVETACQAFGGLDIFVGNAGIYDNRVTLEEQSPTALSTAFDEIFAVNVKGYVLGVAASIAALRKRKGCVVLTASVSSVAPGFGGSLYVASKHAVAGLTRQLAFELAPDIRVNAIAPGYAQTGLSGIASLGQGRTTTGPSAQRLPLRCFADPEDYASFYVALASAQGNRAATGSVLVLDGGLSLYGRPQPAAE